MILFIDNYDSFVANIARYFRRIIAGDRQPVSLNEGEPVRVVRNDELTVQQVGHLRPESIVISPGPCTPDEGGISMDVIREYRGRIPILGICLGHQAIAAALGANIIRAAEPIHGRQSTIDHFGHPLFENVPQKFEACRYHSLVVDPDSLGDDLQVIARTADGAVMGIAHADQPLYGLQFHPESILTPFGFQILENFLKLSQSPGLARETKLGTALFASESRPLRGRMGIGS
ncbi:aminodeoxychorismate/anthranilate synthase component II [Pirellulaceae bacterium]|nr:aminodeoxychorismate/anthranilate synthase component II [Pirellulaceae bacterium]